MQRVISHRRNTQASTLLKNAEVKAAASLLGCYVPLAILTWYLMTKIPLSPYGQGYVLYLYRETQDLTFSPEGKIVSDDFAIANLCEEVVLVSCILYSTVCSFKEQSKAQACYVKLDVRKTLEHINLPPEDITAFPQTAMNTA